jgi:C4-dicarboxylate-specific signal transduction histidine kinase
LEIIISNPYIKISTYKEDNNLVLEVCDNGGGVPEEIKAKIFDPYFSTKTQKDGTGLGLYMSKMIVKDLCGGKLSVSNGEDGAIFRIVFTTEDDS